MNGAHDAGDVLRSARRRRPVDDWALVLASQGIPAAVRRDDGLWVLAVPDAERDRARAALEAYDAENRPGRGRRDFPAVDPHPLRSAGLASAALLAFFLVTGPRNASSPWFERGSADAAKLLAGETWRAVTALTLHADGPHVAGNAVFGALFWSAVSRSLGPGLALGCVVLAGALGNLVNAWAQLGTHVSVGASTAVFGGVGILGGLGVTHRLRLGARGRHAWVPVAAGLGLLAMIGTAGERVDIWAHAFGLAAGVGVGAAAGRLAPPRPGTAWQWSGGALGLAALVGAWWLALR